MLSGALKGWEDRGKAMGRETSEFDPNSEGPARLKLRELATIK